MTKLSQHDQDALAFHFIDVITGASPSEAVRVLSENGFEDQFPYGANPQKAQLLLQSLYVGNREKFVSLVKQMKIDYSRISQNDKLSYQKLVNPSNPNAKMDWINGIVDMITPKTTTGESETTTEETTAGAYVGYALVIIAIVGITIYLFKTLK